MKSAIPYIARWFLIFHIISTYGGAFVTTSPSTAALLEQTSPRTPSLLQSQFTPREEAEQWLAESRALREEIEKSENHKASSRNTKEQKSTLSSKWSVIPPEQEDGECGVEYRLYVDIGRELGTWMDPRWGASGRRIEFTLDVRFLPKQLASADTAAKKMVDDNKGGKKSPTYALQSAPFARLRSGFDQIKCTGGAYRIDKGKPGQSDTLRFYIMTEGTPENDDSSYGDIFIPSGGMYFSIPCFGSVNQLSSKGEMPVTIRQMGWHTGWRREESRIVGIFKAVPVDQARKKDGF